MTLEDIRTEIKNFGKAAIIAQRAGFDAIELHAGHGYLISSFLSPAVNVREDEYGGLHTRLLSHSLQEIEN